MLRKFCNAFALAANLLRWRSAGIMIPPILKEYRLDYHEAAVVFVHGFGGGAETWTGFIDLLLAEQSIGSWDVLGVTYPSSFRIDIPNLWAADPNIENLATELVTMLSQLPLSRYKRIALVAHSMGGLVVQRAILDDPALSARLSHVIFFGTPSGGLGKAAIGKGFKRQLRDMGSASAFIQRLRSDWGRKFAAGFRFVLWVLQGDRDEFVSGASSLVPFPKKCQRVVPGNHLEIVRPVNRNHLGFQLVVQTLGGQRVAMPAVDGARLAVELGQFQEAVDTLLPRAAEIDDAAMVTLALGLDGLGRSGEALELLEANCKKDSPDALGVLGGRIKRRWLAQRSFSDLIRAKEMYKSGLEIALRETDHEQAYYHAINIAFLDLLSAPITSRLPEKVSLMARKALEHCAQAEQNQWCAATQGEAHLMLGDCIQAKDYYCKAIALTNSPRERDSMYSQAIRVALRACGESGGRTIEQAFGVAILPNA